MSDSKFNKAGLADFFVPLSEEKTTLRGAYVRLMAVGNPSGDVPLIVKLAENPEFHFLGFGFFKGRVTLKQHDYIHIVLGRGLTLMDEAFVIGFTMGSSNRVSTQEKEMFSFIASKLYPKPYRFTKDGTQVFKDAVHMGYISDCDPLEGVDFEPLLDLPLGEVRRRIKLEVDFLQAYYRIEARRYPDSAMSQRLVSNDPVNR